MNKLTEQQIIYALERCGQHKECCYCNAVEECGSKKTLVKNMLDLLNRKNEEIKRLNDKITYLYKEIARLALKAPLANRKDKEED